MTCKECVHYEVCAEQVERMHEDPYVLEEGGVDIYCEFFKPKYRFVEVVRCKECKFYKPQQITNRRKGTVKYCCRCATVKVSENDFCSYGENALKERENE